MRRDRKQAGTTRSIIAAAGLAAVALQGCSSSGSGRSIAANSQPAPEPVATPSRSAGAAVAERVPPAPATNQNYSTQFVRGENAGSTQENTSAFARTGLNRQPAFAGPEGSDGWQFVDATGSAERTPEPAPQPQNPQQGPNMASTLYGQLLDMEIPFEGDLLAQHTTNMRQVTYTDDGSVFDPVVSRDGRHLFFSSTQHRPTADVYVQEVGSRVITRLTNDSAQDVMPAISPDGTRIAFASNRAGNWDIWVMPATGGKAIQITTDGGHDLHPSWSPDGQHLVFSRLGTTSGRWELWVADVFNNVRTQFIGYGLFPEWSPIASTGINGWDQILFQRSRERGKRTFAVWTIDFNKQTLQAGNETQIVSNPEAALINPTWSPDAQWITFSAVPNPEKWIGKGNEALPPSAGVWMIGVDGRGELPLTAGDSIDMMPAWSPMGQLFFVSNRNGAENLWSIDIAPALLTASGGNPFANGVRPNRTEVVSRPAPSQPLQPQQGFAQGQPQQGFGQPRVVSNLQSKQGVPPVQQPAPIREVTPFFQNSQQLWPSPSPRPVIADVPTDSDG